jgi:ketosteroid isomerase-like protein
MSQADTHAQENVEIAKRANDAENGRDLNAFAELATEDVEWFPSIAGGLDRGGYKGREGMERYYQEYDEMWDSFTSYIDEYRAVGDTVVALGRIEGKGRGSGVPVSTPVGTVIEFRDGKISRARVYRDHDEALRAAGLEG